MLPEIILASQSPRRSQLLKWAEVRHEVIVSATDESYPAGLSPAASVMHIALGKAEAVIRTNKIDKPVLAADTMVICDGLILGKPENEVQAIRMLTMLSGKKHDVITGVCIYFGDEKFLFADTTTVEFNILTPSQIAFYVHKYRPYDKAGAYGIQEWIGVVGIKCIEGDFYNVMGLPISKVVKMLSSLPRRQATAAL